jgi:hypothetical protein
MLGVENMVDASLGVGWKNTLFVVEYKYFLQISARLRRLWLEQGLLAREEGKMHILGDRTRVRVSVLRLFPRHFPGVFNSLFSKGLLTIF